MATSDSTGRRGWSSGSTRRHCTGGLPRELGGDPDHPRRAECTVTNPSSRRRAGRGSHGSGGLIHNLTVAPLSSAAGTPLDFQDVYPSTGLSRFYPSASQPQHPRSSTSRAPRPGGNAGLDTLPGKGHLHGAEERSSDTSTPTGTAGSS